MHPDKPFKCDHCAQSFSAKQALTQHVLIHKNAKPLKCDICGKAFRQQSALSKLHQQNLLAFNQKNSC